MIHLHFYLKNYYKSYSTELELTTDASTSSSSKEEYPTGFSYTYFHVSRHITFINSVYFFLENIVKIKQVSLNK